MKMYGSCSTCKYGQYKEFVTLCNNPSSKWFEQFMTHLNYCKLWEAE